MTSRKRRPGPRETAPLPCADVGPDDGVDPRLLFRAAPRRDDRHVLRLCSQVREALTFALAGLCRDEVLQSLHVVSVTPAPDASRLEATCATGDPPDVVRERLARVAALLRAEVAASVHRRRAPELVFRVVAGDGAGFPNETPSGSGEPPRRDR